VSKAREGSISASAAVSNTQREVIQSSHITEYYFAEHNDVKKRVLVTGLETAKLAWANSGTRKLQFVTNDMATQIINIDTEDLQSIEQDLYISDSRNDQELRDNLKQLAHAALQNDKLDLSTLMDIFNSEALSTIRRKIETAETGKKEIDAKNQQQAQEMQSEQLQAQAQEKENERQYALDLENLKASNNITLEHIKAQYHNINRDLDLDGDGVKDAVEIEKTKLDIEAKAREAEKERKHESVQNEKDRKNKKELEKLKAKKKNI